MNTMIYGICHHLMCCRAFHRVEEADQRKTKNVSFLILKNQFNQRNGKGNEELKSTREQTGIGQRLLNIAGMDVSNVDKDFFLLFLSFNFLHCFTSSFVRILVHDSM